jgi:hypothetical protein
MDCNRSSHTGIPIPSPNTATQNPIPSPIRNRSVDSPNVRHAIRSRHASHSRRVHCSSHRHDNRRRNVGRCNHSDFSDFLRHHGNLHHHESRLPRRGIRHHHGTRLRHRDPHAGQKQTAVNSRAQYMRRLRKELLTTSISSFQFPPLSVGLALEPLQSLYAVGRATASAAVTKRRKDHAVRDEYPSSLLLPSDEHNYASCRSLSNSLHESRNVN